MVVLSITKRESATSGEFDQLRRTLKGRKSLTVMAESTLPTFLATKRKQEIESTPSVIVEEAKPSGYNRCLCCLATQGEQDVSATDVSATIWRWTFRRHHCRRKVL